LVVSGVDVGIFEITYENGGSKKIIWGVLVGAFSDFGGLDTDNPVQILTILEVFAANPFPEGLI